MAHLIDTGVDMLVSWGWRGTSSANRQYGIWVDAATHELEVWEDIDSVDNKTQIGTATSAEIHATTTTNWVDAAFDSNDDIHIICGPAQPATRDFSYCVFDLSTGFGAWEEAAAVDIAGWLCKINVDSNDYPWVLFEDMRKVQGASKTRLYMTNRTGGSWSAPETVSANADKNDAYNMPMFSFAPGDDIEAVYHFITDGDAAYKRRNGSWAGESIFVESDVTTLNDVLVTTGDLVYRYYVEHTGYSIKENGVDTGYDTHSVYKRFAASLGSDGARYVLFVNADQNIQAIKNDGSGWVNIGVILGGENWEDIRHSWVYNNANQSDDIPYLVVDGSFVYYDTHRVYADSNAAILSATNYTNVIQPLGVR